MIAKSWNCQYYSLIKIWTSSFWCFRDLSFQPPMRFSGLEQRVLPKLWLISPQQRSWPILSIRTSIRTQQAASTTNSSAPTRRTSPWSCLALWRLLLDDFWLRQELRESVCPSVCPYGTSMSKALNLHLSLIGVSQVSLRSVSGQSQVSLRSLWVYFVKTEPKILRLVWF